MTHPKNTPVVIYHNARCSKSRSACDIVAGQGVEAQVIEYMRTPPTKEELRSLVKKLGLKPADIVRRGEDIFKEHYVDKNLTDEQWLDALVAHPILIERPIIVRGERAVIGRPPEKVLELLNKED